MVRNQWIWWLLGALLLLGCGEDLRAKDGGRIETFPREQLTFNQVSAGEQSERSLAITNQGSGTLTLNAVDWEGSEDIVLRFPDGSLAGTSMEPGDVVEFLVVYTPRASILESGGDIVIQSSDPERSTLRVEVITQKIGPRIQVTPDQGAGLAFGQVATGGSEWLPLSITNVGTLPLVIDELILNTSEEFQLSLPSGVSFPYTIADTSTSLDFEVQYSPSGLGEDTGELIVVSNDPIEPQYPLEISANSSAPCAKLSEQSVEFPAVAIGGVRSRIITIESCGAVPLELGGIVRLSGDPVEFFIDEPTPLAELVLEYQETAAFEVFYAPIDVGVDSARFELVTNDPIRPRVPIDIIGSGTDDQCPTAIAKGGLPGGSINYDQVSAVPLDTLKLNGQRSTDAESAIVEWSWEVTERPEGSTSPLDDAGDGTASLFLDLAGAYEVCLKVKDAQGTESCNTSCVSADVRPNQKIHIQLVWTTPDDTILNDDIGADLDLHFTRIPEGVWGDIGSQENPNGWDVHYFNQQPTWSVEGGTTEHPTLDRDDRDGEGPENINLDDPNPCSWYAVGIHYFNDQGFDLTVATLRIYVNGQRRFEKVNIPLELGGVDAGDFWYVALLHWDGETARALDISERTYGDSWVGTQPSLPEDAVETIQELAPECFDSQNP